MTPIMPRHMLLTRILVIAIIFFSATSANALKLLCHLPSAIDGTLIETLKIDATDGSVSVWHKWEQDRYHDEREQFEKVLFHSMTTIPVDSRFSVIVVESRFVWEERKIDITYPPEVYFVDWGMAKLAQVNVPAVRKPTAQVDVRWECERVD